MYVVLVFWKFIILTIISTRVRYARKNKKRTESRRNSEGLTSREQQKQDLIKKIQILKNQGLKQKEVSEKLNKSIRTIKNYWTI